MPPVNILIKPASSRCNMRCRYCFYHDVASMRKIKDLGVMKEETLKKLIKNGIDYGDHLVSFAFQGGEPTLAGLDFLKKLFSGRNNPVKRICGSIMPFRQTGI